MNPCHRVSGLMKEQYRYRQHLYCFHQSVNCSTSGELWQCASRSNSYWMPDNVTPVVKTVTLSNLCGYVQCQRLTVWENMTTGQKTDFINIKRSDLSIKDLHWLWMRKSRWELWINKNSNVRNDWGKRRELFRLKWEDRKTKDKQQGGIKKQMQSKNAGRYTVDFGRRFGGNWTDR